MARINQKGIAPVIRIIGLAALGVVTFGGTYFYLKSQQVKPIFRSAEQAAPLPAVSEGSSIEEVKETNEKNLLDMKGVEKVELGEKDKKPCIVVFTYEETDELQSLEDNGLNGYQVKIQNAAQTQ